MFSFTVRRLIGAAAVVCLAASAVVVGSVAVPAQTLALPGASESSVVTIEPTRVADTRDNVGLTGKISAETSRKFTVTGVIDTYIDSTKTTVVKQVVPAGATGVFLNVTVVTPSASGFLAIRPGTANGIPATGGLNFGTQTALANGVLVALPASGDNDGQIDIYYGTPTPDASMHVVIDVVGYTTTSGLIALTKRIETLETSGTAGPAGAKGEPGINGNVGATGNDGATGPAGANGNDGTSCTVADNDDGTATMTCTDGTSVTFGEDPVANTVTARALVGGSPFGVGFDGTNIWVATDLGAYGPAGPDGIYGNDVGLSDWVRKVDPVTNTVTATVTVGSNPTAVAFDGTNIWVTNYGSGTVSKIDPVTDTVTATVTVGSNPNGVGFDGTNIWVTNYGSGTVSKIDPVTNTVTATVPIANAVPDPNVFGFILAGVGFDGTNIWVTSYGPGPGLVSKIDPVTNTVTATVTVGSTPGGVGFDGTNIWVTNSGSGTVSKIDPVTNTVTATVTVGGSPFGVGFDGTNIWVTNSGSGTVSKIDPVTNTVTATIFVGSRPFGVAFDGTNIWVTNYGSEPGLVFKIDPG
jgi:YVTN family beta-propeller protein